MTRTVTGSIHAQSGVETQAVSNLDATKKDMTKRRYEHGTELFVL